MASVTGAREVFHTDAPAIRTEYEKVKKELVDVQAYLKSAHPKTAAEDRQYVEANIRRIDLMSNMHALAERLAPQAAFFQTGGMIQGLDYDGVHYSVDCEDFWRQTRDNLSRQLASIK